ncbi:MULTISPECIES: glycosyltransferase family 2 protein [unclassified Mucilaginibacter]|uniref:glycosyltransferase family 2 protein n=1 Tax=unclassified Mucilaginibacter TaxID=2617802 RepID=UPI002AC99256|nr:MULTISPECIES: glycosyltransferase family 2 protein [unclassified Mucilaginibacter]MEB0261116.1 glycosyltransferase family 2 protein [Mucilaginibacter sp. 10I4]MEB0280491.1 glycosyltransferase family 2 protein [Mucilaginibacter sp. 10B2]MEB0301303.1 glycosyltransferase family 2 protein [Mucilaginibacter sp. 5C4]WPX22466.1 glycosyltransferase family 2 protein [Mucilaginibacter sp. 5C4]
MKVITVIVTYNRLQLLKRCVNAVIDQTMAPNEIIVINNGSTDGTAAWLLEQTVTTFTQKNEGGAGGFSAGIKLAYDHSADWIWLMDDDTIPQKDALQQLASALKEFQSKHNNIGFLSSYVHWTDGNIHEMNRTYLLNDKSKIAKLKISSGVNLPLIQFGTFVSMLISSKAVEKVGLPIKDYFIWNDDVEYSKRIIANGLAGLRVDGSITLHETPINSMSSVFTDTYAQLWKYRFGMRNELFTKRLHEGEFQFWITWVHRMFIMPFRLAINRKNHRWPFIKMIWETSLQALRFRPTIEKV